ncbi:MAG: IPT/TIG domain-containing protein [Chitinophagaceae bacterium]|nr:IPT/TIG domain-containing protein [Chitinophagaceae bacterium]
MILKTIGRVAGGVLLVTILQISCKKKDAVAPPVVSITSVSETLLNIGDTLRITGANFSTTPGQNLVSVASVSFPVVRASANELWVVVPKGAQTGKLSIGYKGGQATQFDQQLTITGANEPVILSITPATAYEGDTIIITGKNFSTPNERNAITFTGINGIYPGKIYNATPTELKVVVPVFAANGPVQVTSDGVSSQTFPYNITRVNPGEDGNLYWMTVDPTVYPATASLYKGLANNTLPQSSSFYNGAAPFQKNFDINAPFYPDIGENDISAPIYNYVVNDLRHNAYYLTNDAVPFPSHYNLMKLSADGAFNTPVSVWNLDLEAPGTYTNFYLVPDDPINNPPLQYPYCPLQQLAIDGNKLYIKMGFSDDYYVGDMSQPSPVFTLQKNVFGDSSAYYQQFGKDYIFYTSVGYVTPMDGMPHGFIDPDYIGELKYTRRGSHMSESIPLPVTFQDSYSGRLVCTLADPSHGNELLIVTSTLNSARFWRNTIYKFNADTRELTVLYNERNWPDALSNINQYDNSRIQNSGFIWLGPHIYYTNTSALKYSVMRRLNDNGISPRIYTVYSRMEPLDEARKTTFKLFTGK